MTKNLSEKLVKLEKEFLKKDTIVYMKEDGDFYKSGDLGIIDGYIFDTDTLTRSLRIGKFIEEYSVDLGDDDISIACTRDKFIPVGEL